MLILARRHFLQIVFQLLFLFYCPFQVTIHNCSPPLPPRPWRSVRMQGWPSPLGCPTSTTNSWRRFWTSRGSSTNPSATRWAAQLLSLLLFRTSFLHWSVMSVCPPRSSDLCGQKILHISASVWMVWIESITVSLIKSGWKLWGGLPAKLW